MLLLLPVFAACAPVTQTHGWGAPVAIGDMLIVSNSTGTVSGLKLSASAPPVVAWTFPPDDTSQDPWYKKLFASGKSVDRLEAIYAGPVVGKVGQQDRVFISGYSGVIVALDPQTGNKINGWPTVNVGGRIAATPAFDGQRLYVADNHGRVRTIDPQTGAIGSPILETASRIWSAPLLDRGVLYVASLDHHVRAVDPASGAVRWDHDLGGAVAGDVAFAGDLMLVPTLGSRLVALDTTAQGAERWAFEGDNWFWARPLVVDNTVYATTSGGTVYAIDLGTGKERWHNDSLQAEVHAAPVMVGGTLVVASRNGVVIGLDPASGAQRWRSEVSGERFLANPLVLESAVLYLAEDGSLHRVRPQDNGSTERLFSKDK